MADVRKDRITFVVFGPYGNVGLAVSRMIAEYFSASRVTLCSRDSCRLTALRRDVFTDSKRVNVMAGDVAEPSVAFDAIHSTHNQCELCVVIDASGTWRGVEEDFSAERVLSYLAPAVRIYEAVCRLTSFLPLHYLYLAGSVAGTVLPFFPGQFEYSLAKLAMHHCLVSGHERGVGFTISMATLGLVEGTDLSKLGPGTRVTDTLVDPREVAHWALERINNPEGTEWYKTFLGNYQVVVE